jgi:hypothetical protein
VQLALDVSIAIVPVATLRSVAAPGASHVVTGKFAGVSSRQTGAGVAAMLQPSEHVVVVVGAPVALQTTRSSP